MFKEYFKVAWRFLWRQKIYAMLNIVGLTVALTSSLLICLYVLDEFSYDRFHEKADRIVRVASESGNAEEVRLDYYAPVETVDLFSEIPEVETVVQFMKAHGPVVRRGETLLQSETIYATENFFDVFSHEFLAGDPRTALQEQYSVVLTDSFATLYFGDEQALGETLMFYQEGIFNDQPFTVTGVIEDVPHNTSFNFDKVLSIRSHPNYSPENTTTASFLLLRDGASLDIVRDKVEILNDKYFGDQTRYGGGMRLRLQPIAEVHLDPPLDREWIPGGGGGNMQNVLILIAVGAFLVLIACVNYMNLATARSSKRAREIGVRKVAGASRRQLIGQHLAEAVGVTSIAFLLALGLALLCLPILNQITDKDIGLAFLTRGHVLLALGGGTLLIGLGAGIYPALYMTAFSPAEILKSTTGEIMRGRRFRGMLVVGQFTLSVAMIVFALVVYQQLHYIQNKDLGFDRETVIVIDNTTWLGDQQQAFLEELRRHRQVVSAGYAQTFPGRLWNISKAPFYERRGEIPSPGEEAATPSGMMDVYVTDDGFLPALGIDVLAGRNFFAGNSSDTSAVLINSAAVRALEWEEPVSRPLYQRQYRVTQDENGEWQPHFYVKEYRVIGVIEDFHHYPLQQEIEPMVVIPSTFGLATAVIRVGPGDVEELLASMEDLWKQIQPRYPFVHYFLDEQFEATYRQDIHFGRLAGFFTGLSILIACLGILGLAAFTAERRTKEIGIRKVLGASVKDVLAILCVDMLKWVVVACVIGLPLGYVVTRIWLNNFAYNIDVGPLVFVIAGLTASAFAVLSVTTQTLRAATANPVTALRHD